MRHLIVSIIGGLAMSVAAASDRPTAAPLVIDTDMGLDDAVTVALALQNPRAELLAIVAGSGASRGGSAVEYLERLLDRFNRRDVPLYAAAEPSPAGPQTGAFPLAEEALSHALPEPVEPFRRPFTPAAYGRPGTRATVLALGPLTNLAEALRSRPEIVRHIARVVISGPPEREANWNARFDPDAFAAVTASGIPLAFVISGSAGGKPAAWKTGELTLGPGTSIAEDFIRRLLQPAGIRDHYTGRLGTFGDELVFLHWSDPAGFVPTDRENVFTPRSPECLLSQLTSLLDQGRQARGRVVLVDGPLPDEMLRDDLRARKGAILAKNGPVEWFAQLLLSELHQHLGVYSVIGVKMGLRAAELLNAPQHATKIVSRVPPRPPQSCLNDGLIVATGCTPGRGLFSHVPDPAGRIAADFEYNGRTIRLELKAEYRERIQREFRALSDAHEHEEGDYWDAVDRLGLDIWENWHRRDLFEVSQITAQ